MHYDFYTVIWAFRIVYDNISWQFSVFQKINISILPSIWHFMPFPGKMSVLQIRRARNKSPINLITPSTWESDRVHLQAISFVPFYFEFYFPPGPLYVRPQKVSQDCFLWNWVASFYFSVTSVYFFQSKSFLLKKILYPFNVLPPFSARLTDF